MWIKFPGSSYQDVSYGFLSILIIHWVMDTMDIGCKVWNVTLFVYMHDLPAAGDVLSGASEKEHIFISRFK